MVFFGIENCLRGTNKGVGTSDPPPPCLANVPSFALSYFVGFPNVNCFCYYNIVIIIARFPATSDNMCG